MATGSSSDMSSTVTQNDSGVQDNLIPSTPKRKKLEVSAKDSITDTLLVEICNFGTVASRLIIKVEKTDEDYRGLYRLYKTSLKVLNTLETESAEIEDELKPLPLHAERILQSTNENVRLWSEHFYQKSSPTKLRKPNTMLSPTTARIRALIHAVASVFGLTAEAVCSNKRRPENNKNLENLLKISKIAIAQMTCHRDEIENELKAEAPQLNKLSNSGVKSNSLF